MLSQEIENYILTHSEEEDEILKEITRRTNLEVLFPRMLSGHIQGKLLEFLSRMIQPANILEIGTYTSYSCLCLAKGLKQEGKIHTIEINDELEDFIRHFITKANMQNSVTLHIGDAKNIIPTLNCTFDLVFIDGDKREYLAYYELVMQKLRPGGFILADNVLWSGKVTQQIESNDLYTKGIHDFNSFVKTDSRVRNFILPIRDGLSILQKI